MIEQSEKEEFEKHLFCAECESKNVVTEQKEHTFPYGARLKPITLTVTIPVRICKDCNFMWYDYIAEELIDNAVKEHLKSKG